MIYPDQVRVPSSSILFIIIFLTPQRQQKAEAAGFRRCQGTYPSRRRRPWPPSIRPCRRVRSLQRRGRLSYQTTALGSFPDGRLNKNRDRHLPRGIFPGSCGWGEGARMS